MKLSVRRSRILKGLLSFFLGGTALFGAVVLGASFWPGPAGPRMFTDIATPEMADAHRQSEGACWGDIDGDGDEDLFVANYRGHSRLWRNDGGGVFADIASTAGVQRIGQPQGCSFVDVDGDGDLDLYITSRRLNAAARRGGHVPTRNLLFKNLGDGRFRDATDVGGVAVTQTSTASTDWGDYDGDGRLDAFVAARYGSRERRNVLFRQRAPGRFQDMAAETGVADPAGPPTVFLGSWFDYDGDGDLDLLLAIDFWGVELYRNDNGRFVRVTAEALPPATDGTPGAPPNNAMGVAWGDYDNDGCVDVLVTGANMAGQGGFEAATLGDLASRLYRSNCNSGFTDATVAARLHPTGVTEWSPNFVDYDNDGDLDLSVVAGNATSASRRGLLDAPTRLIARLVSIPRSVIPYRLAAWAYRYEAMIPARGTNGPGGAMPNFLYQNRLVETGVADFVDVTQRVGVGNFGASRGSAWADMDGDGDLDWFIPGRETPNRLFRNDGPVGNYLRVHPVRASRPTVGTWVRIRAGRRVQFRHVHVLEGFLSQSQMDPHFGLAAARTVDEVWVRWPNTSSWLLTCRDVPANRTVVVTEGQGCRWQP